MEKMTLTIAMSDHLVGETRDIAQIWIDEEEVATVGITLEQLLTQMHGHGWTLGRATMYPNKEGAVITYYYEKCVELS